MASSAQDAPFVVRPSISRFGPQVALALMMLLGGAVLTSVSVPAGLVLALPGVLILAVSFLSLRDRAPLLSADRRGLTIRTGRGADALRTLRWNEIERVYAHPLSRSLRLLCVLPRDIERELRALPERRAAMEKSLQVCGAPYSLNLVAAGLSAQQVGVALRGLAGGRTTLDLPG